MRSIALIARTVTESNKTDIKISYWKSLLLAIPTLGIYNMVTYYRLLRRLENHFKRQHMLYKDIVLYLQEYATTNKSYVEGLPELKSLIADVQYDEEPLSSRFWFIFSLLTLGCGVLYPLYRLTTDIYIHEGYEDEVLKRINDILCTEGILDRPVEKSRRCKKRIFFLYIFLTLITAGLFSLYWSYVIINDANSHFDEHSRWEIIFLETLSNY